MPAPNVPVPPWEPPPAKDGPDAPVWPPVPTYSEAQLNAELAHLEAVTGARNGPGTPLSADGVGDVWRDHRRRFGVIW